METKIKNTSEDIGKVIIRISNKLAFAYTFEPDHVFINDDMNNYRYATKEEETIYNTNKSPDDRFYSLINAPELRHEILKERIEALHEVYKHVSLDIMYKLVTCDMSRKYWQHELNESKDKEIEALKKQVSSLIQYKDSLTKDLVNSENWIDVSIEPEFGGEYNVVYDLLDGEELVVSTMDYDKTTKLWMDTRGANIPIHTVKLWKELPGFSITNKSK